VRQLRLAFSTFPAANEFNAVWANVADSATSTLRKPAVVLWQDLSSVVAVSTSCRDSVKISFDSIMASTAISVSVNTKNRTEQN